MARVSRLRFMNIDRTALPVRPRVRSRGVPNALREHPVAYTEDLDQAALLTGQLLGKAALIPGQSTRPFEFILNAVQFLDVTLAYVDFAAACTCTVQKSVDAYTVHMTTSGMATVLFGDQEYELTPFTALVVSPGSGYQLRLSDDTPQLVVRIERAALERQLSRMLGKSLGQSVVFDPVSDLTKDSAQRWNGALNILFAEIMSSESLVQKGIGAGALEELVISTLLYIQPHSFSERLINPNKRSGRLAVRRSIDYIESHLSEPITLADLIAYCQMSGRSIQAGFREDLDTSPVAFIRDRRLDEVRRTLMSASPAEGLSVTEAAHRWGFNHLGKFAQQYRARFGETPSRTLKG